ncbi:MAG: flagellar motor switch phosphatase FliY [Alicyclobacillaceae bacterium]|nr:flagellar motor switch phosphatase FliY [Alicyclobacillaceae bacterium]
MGDEMLSQEEIDALLRQHASPSSEPSPEAPLSEMEKDAIGEIGNITFGTAATALSTLLNKRVEITTPTVTTALIDELGHEFPLPHVAVQVHYTAGFEGVNVLFIRIRDAQIIADLMMGGDGNPPDGDLNELQLSAVSEAMNQMMGSAATSMSQMFNMVINISPPQARIVDLRETPPEALFAGEQQIVKVAFRLIVDDLIDSHIMQLIPVSFARKMVMALTGEASLSSSAPSVQEDVTGGEPAPGQTAVQTGSVSPVGASGSSGEAGATMGSQTQSSPEAETAATSQVVVQPVQFGPLQGGNAETPRTDNLDLLLDIPLTVSVELGRTRQSVREVLAWTLGSVVELDRLAGEPVDIYVNNKLIAKGEVVVIDENFGVRVTDIVHPRDRMRGVQ